MPMTKYPSTTLRVYVSENDNDLKFVRKIRVTDFDQVVVTNLDVLHTALRVIDRHYQFQYERYNSIRWRICKDISKEVTLKNKQIKI